MVDGSVQPRLQTSHGIRSSADVVRLENMVWLDKRWAGLRRDFARLPGTGRSQPAFQGLGLGRLLLDWADRRASAADVPELRLYTNAQMKNNLALYQRCGYAIFNTRPHPSRPGELLVDLRRTATAL